MLQAVDKRILVCEFPQLATRPAPEAANTRLSPRSQVLCLSPFTQPKMAPNLRAEGKSDEDNVSLTQVSEMLRQQKQQENFKGFVKIMIDSTNTRLETLS